MVTGNNRYFCLSPREADGLGLTTDELLPISPPGSRHLRGLTFTKRAWRELAQAGRPVYLFAPRDDLEQSMSTGAAAYVAEGQAENVHAAYKCRVRAPWWRVPGASVPDLFLTYMNHDTPRLVTNEAAVAYLNSVHGVTLTQEHRKLGRDLLPIGVLNALTLLGAELVGRSYGGGILKVEPKEADLLPVPSPSVLAGAGDALRALRPQLAKYLRSGRLPEAVALVDRVLLVEHLGLKRADVAQLRQAHEMLFARRVARGGH